MRTLPFPSVTTVPVLLVMAACSGNPSISTAVGGEHSAGGTASEGGLPSWGGVGGGTNTGGKSAGGGSSAFGGNGGAAQTTGSDVGGTGQIGGASFGGSNAGGAANTGGVPASGGLNGTGATSGGTGATSGGTGATSGGTSATSAGTCSNDSSCPASAHCSSGACVCWDTSAKICDGQCTGVLWDANNCGECDRGCPSSAPACSNGQCVCFSPPCGVAGSGGAAATGGAPPTGGTPPTGGATGNGGALATGGAVSTGGSFATGGALPAGGAVAASGGMQATGGTLATGGTRPTGGAPATGGNSSAGSSACAINGGPSSANGELTCYYFGQGTTQATCNGSPSYKTNCGYCGTEGSSSGSACSTSHNDRIAHISTGDYFVAVPNFSASSCGVCLSVSYAGKTIVATVVDNCATCTSAGHIDLSSAAGAALGLGTSTTENPQSGVTWKAVSCPVANSSIVAGYNNSYTGQLYFQNVAFPVASASAVVSGTTRNATLSMTNAYWDFGTNLSPGTSLTLKDTQGHTVTGTLQGNGLSIGAQFPTNCQ